MKIKMPFIKLSLLIFLFLTYNSCKKKSSIDKNKEKIKYEWTMVTSWPPNFPILGESANKIAKEIEIMSNGQMKIKVYGAGELIQGLEVFDAVSTGKVEIGHSASYYWTGKSSSSMFFSTIPFGLSSNQMNSWLLFGGGLELWNELYSTFNLTVFPVGNSSAQMGGWFNKKINSINDFKGLKMRIPGMGGKVISKLGGSSINMAGGEIYSNLEKNVIDAAEWIGPYHDYIFGFHKIAQYYYYPGWHEPGTTFELIINKSKYESLPDNLKEIIKVVSLKYNLLTLAEFEQKNGEYLSKLKSENNIQILKFPDDVITNLKIATNELINEEVSKNEFSKKVYESISHFKKLNDELNKLYLK